MAKNDDIYQLIMKGRDYQNREFSNTFYYLYQGPTDDSNQVPLSLINLFNQNILVDIVRVFHNSSVVHTLETLNLFNVAEFEELTIATTGTETGPSGPSFVAVGFRSNRVVRNIRRGYKRFGPVAEDIIAGNSYDPTKAGTIQDIDNALGEILQDTVGGWDFVPIVVKRVKESDGAGGFTYRLPLVETEAEWANATSWEFYAVTTQNSRKG